MPDEITRTTIRVPSSLLDQLDDVLTRKETQQGAIIEGIKLFLKKRASEEMPPSIRYHYDPQNIGLHDELEAALRADGREKVVAAFRQAFSSRAGTKHAHGASNTADQGEDLLRSIAKIQQHSPGAAAAICDLIAELSRGDTYAPSADTPFGQALSAFAELRSTTEAAGRALRGSDPGMPGDAEVDPKRPPVKNRRAR